jgi:DNA polymerase-3 subunit epsilon
MFGIDRWLRRPIHLTDAQATRLRNWQALPKSQIQHSFEAARLVVLDVETTGLNLVKDKLIAIGAIAVVLGKVDLSDSFEVVLQQNQASSKSNILIHGIGGSAQTSGKLPADALLDFLEYVGGSPLVAFHVTFDQTMLCRALRQFLGVSFKSHWLDLAYVAPGLHPEKRLHALDDWLNLFNIQAEARHNALADAVSTAQLLMILIHVAKQQNILNYAGLQSVEKNQRWVSWQG